MQISDLTLLKLDVVIIGGGTAGLSTAYTLSKVGHRVRLIENHDLEIVAGGAHITPNSNKILRRWFGDEEVKSWSQYIEATSFYDLADNSDIGYVMWHPALMKEVGADWGCMHYGDLRTKLYQQAISAGARVDFKTSVVSVCPGTGADPKPSVTLSTGEVITPDMVIGADGSSGITRKLVVPNDVVKPFGTFFCGIVSADFMNSHPVLSEFPKKDEVMLWMGKDTILNSFPLRDRSEYAIRLHLMPGAVDPEEGEEVWHDVIPSSKLRFEGCDPLIADMLYATGSMLRYRLTTHDAEDEDWVDATNRILLVGDAAHVVMTGAQSHSLAMEDAVVLGRLLERISNIDQLPIFLKAFRQLRQPRREFCAQNEFGSIAMMTMPPGPGADARDSHFSSKEDAMKPYQLEEGALRQQLDEYFEIYGYDATDAVDEWWYSWGRFSEKHRFMSVADQGSQTRVTF